MSTANVVTAEQKEAALKFLERDFNQCFEQMRYYDTQIVEILKFLLTAETALIGGGLAVYKYGVNQTQGPDYTLPAIAALAVGLLLGVFMFSLAIINRIYFVKVARYINEQRGLFMNFHPLGFMNEAGMPTDPHHPSYFSWNSTQICFIYVIAAINSALTGVLLVLLNIELFGSGVKWGGIIALSLILFGVHLAAARWYLGKNK